MNLLTPVAESVEELERCASILDASGDYRILRRLRLTTADRPPATVGIRRGVFVDTETTGLDPDTDEILELAMLAFDYSVDGIFVMPTASFDRLRDPGRPISAEVSALTGITDEMVCGKNIDPAEVVSFLEDAALVIAHNSEFDRRFGLYTGLDMRNQSLQFMQANFGKAGSYYYWISRGVDHREVRADRIRKSVGAENTFFTDLTEFDAMVVELEPLIDRVWRYCEGAGNGGPHGDA